MINKTVVPKKKAIQKFKLRANRKLKLESETKAIMEAYDDFSESYQKNSYDALKVGEMLTIIKKKLKEKKMPWMKYIKTEISHIPSFDIRDFMYLSGQYKNFPLAGLLWLNRTNLKKLYQFCQGKSPEKVLADNSIDLISKDATADEIRIFQKEVLELLRPAKDAAKQKNKVTTKQQASDLAESNKPTMITYRTGLLRLMEQSLKKDRLKPFQSKALSNFLDFQKTLAMYIAKRTPQADDE